MISLSSGRLTSLVLIWTPVIALVLIVLGFATQSPRFATLENLQAVLVQSSWLMIAALGTNFVLLTGGVDLSTGAIMYLAAVAVGVELADLPILLLLAAAAFIGLLVGLLNGVLVARFGAPAFVITFATAFVGRGLGLLVSSTKMVFAGPRLSAVGRSHIGIPLPLSVALLGLLIAAVLLRLLPFGRYVLATGANKEGALRTGVPIKSVMVGVYMVSGLYAGLAGLLSLSQTSAVSATFGQGSEFLAIAAAVLGGTSLFGGRGSLWAPVIGAILITAVQNGLVMANANPYAYPLITGGVIFFAALLDSLRLRAVARLERRRFAS